MKDIDTASLLELRFMLESSIDVQFQAWMAITFAVIVASYSGRAGLNNLARTVVAITYFLAAYALFARWMTEGSRIRQIAVELQERGIDFELALLSGQSRIATYVLGTAVALAAIFYFGRETRVHKLKNGENDA